MAGNGLLITRSNIHQLTPNNILSFSSKEYWHKFIIKNGGDFDKCVVLDAVLDSINPFDLVPVKYTIDGNDAYFLARNCGPAIEKFCLNLLLPIPLKGTTGEVTVNIETCCIPIKDFKVNMQIHLKDAIEKRYDESQKGFINLSSFHKEPELFDLLYCPLSKPRFLLYVLSILKRILTVTAIDLSNNDIEVIKPLEVLQEFEGLTSLDLSSNKIDDPNLGALLKNAAPALQEINLNGNPICNHFKTEQEYVKWVRNNFSLIKKIDGVSLNYGLPHQQVWMCSNSSKTVVDEFIEHYFTLYDDNRQALEHTYDKSAIFSMTCDHPASQSAKDLKLECYQDESRSLLKVNDENKIMGVTFCNNTNIVNLLWKLPLTEHDPYSFKVDVLFSQETTIVLVVSGIFKDFQEAPRIRSFNRTFVLKKVAEDEYKITNDLYHITSGTFDEIKSSFLHPKPFQETKETRRYVTEEEEQNLIQVVSRLTEMNPTYSKRCLEDCNWDVKKALEVFLENYEVFNVPPEAFYAESPKKCQGMNLSAYIILPTYPLILSHFPHRSLLSSEEKNVSNALLSSELAVCNAIQAAAD